MSFFCPVCNQKWRIGQKSIQCTLCHGWVHHNNRNNCSGLTNSEFRIHCNESDKPWECDKCIANSIITLPFASLDESNWLEFNENKSISDKLSDDINIIDSLQVKDIISQCDFF